MNTNSETKKAEVEVPSSISNDRAKMDALRTMMRTEGWEILSQYCKDQEAARVAAIMSSPVGSQEEVYRQEYSKAEAWTYHTLAGLPEMLINTMQDNIDLELDKLRSSGVDVSTLREDGDEEEATGAVDNELNAP